VEAVAAQVGVRQAAERKEARLREARDDARASELRAALFSSVTHDLRTPLASIVAGVTSLRADDGQLDAGRRLELLETVAEEAERLDRLVGNILELARARSGALAPEPARLSPDELLDGVLTRLRPRLEGLRVHRVVREDVPAISADPVLLERAITNVLDNAIAHSPPGGTIHVSAAAFGGGSSYASPTRARGSRRRTASGSSSRSSAATTPARAAGSGWRSRARSSPRTPARSGSRDLPAAAPRS
jgi:two-component system sensor histidine kinase KdpD